MSRRAPSHLPPMSSYVICIPRGTESECACDLRRTLQAVQPPSSADGQPDHPTAVDATSTQALAARLVRVLFGGQGTPARTGDGPVVEKITNKLLVRAYKAFTSIKETNAKQLAEAKVHREHGVAWLLADISFKADAALPDRGDAEKAGKRVGTHLGGKDGVIKRLEKIATHATAEKGAKTKGLSEVQLAATLSDVEQLRGVLRLYCCFITTSGACGSFVVAGGELG